MHIDRFSTAEAPYSTEASVWIGASREHFTERMALHFAVVGPGISMYSAMTEKGSGKRLSRKTAHRGAI